MFYFSFGDIAWFLGSLLLLVTTDFVNNSGGVAFVILVALMVVLIGLSQLWAYSEFPQLGLPQNSNEERDFLSIHLTRLSAIGVSWMSIKPWVKWWLFALNGVFFLATFFLPSAVSKMALVSYVATIPLLLAIMIVQRGLTRLLGIAHLLAWSPLVFYLACRLSSDILGVQLSFASDRLLYAYSYTLLGFVVTCLGFDIYDLVRWVSGERARLGSSRENGIS